MQLLAVNCAQIDRENVSPDVNSDKSQTEIAATQAVQLTLLGPFKCVLAAGETVQLTSKKEKLLLAFLALSPNMRTTREQICAVLWADRADEQARSSLRQALAGLRKGLGKASDLISTRDDVVALHEDRIECDACRIIAFADAIEIPIELQNDLMRGGFLADSDFTDEACANWKTMQQKRIAEASISCLSRLSLKAEPTLRVKLVRQMVDLDAYREKSHRELISAYSAAGDVGQAERHRQEAARIFRTELGVAFQADAMSYAQPAPQAREHKLGSKKDRTHITVLPVVSAEASDSLLAGGLTEDIITGLTRYKQFSVLASNTSSRQSETGPDETTNAPSADFKVTGSLRRMGSNLRIVARLSGSSNAEIVWSETYDVPSERFFEIQDSIVLKIVATLFGRVSEASVRHAKLKPPSALSAYELVLRANALNWKERAKKEEAVALLEEAVSIDPAYGFAHCLQAAVRMRIIVDHECISTDSLKPVLHAARLGVSIAPDDSACHSILGWIWLYAQQFRNAETHIRESLRLNPGNTFAIFNWASCLLQTCQPEKALHWIEQAQEADPFFAPDWCKEERALAYMQMERFEEALNQLSGARPRNAFMLAVEAVCCRAVGDAERADAARFEMLSMRPDYSVSILNSIYGLSSKSEAAKMSRLWTSIPLPE